MGGVSVHQMEEQNDRITRQIDLRGGCQGEWSSVGPLGMPRVGGVK